MPRRIGILMPRGEYHKHNPKPHNGYLPDRVIFRVIFAPYGICTDCVRASVRFAHLCWKL